MELYVALNDANWPVITTDPNWTDKRPITSNEARSHLSEKGVEKVLGGRDAVFTERDQSYPVLMALFADY